MSLWVLPDIVYGTSNGSMMKCTFMAEFNGGTNQEVIFSRRQKDVCRLEMVPACWLYYRFINFTLVLFQIPLCLPVSEDLGTNCA